eukprot:5455741-Amphidinium_carterae.1
MSTEALRVEVANYGCTKFSNHLPRRQQQLTPPIRNRQDQEAYSQAMLMLRPRSGSNLAGPSYGHTDSALLSGSHLLTIGSKR